MARPQSDFADEGDFQEDANDFDVIVIGAGLTGLTAAHGILKKRAGLHVLILESNDDIGGRLLPSDFSETFHASLRQEHITELLNELNLTVLPVEEATGRKRVFFTKSGPATSVTSYHAAQIHYFIRTIDKHSSNPSYGTYGERNDSAELAATSVEQLVRQLVFSSPARSLCRSFVYSTCGVRDLNKVSALWFLVMLNGAGGFINRLRTSMGNRDRYFVQNGMKIVAQKLLNEILSEGGFVKYSEPATKIEFNNDRTYVYTTRDIIKCCYVVVAVPPPESSNILIEPSMPENLLKSQSLFVRGENVFFNIRYNRPFWTSDYRGDILSTIDARTNLCLAYEAAYYGYKKESVLAGFLEDLDEKTSKLPLPDTIARSFRNTEAHRFIYYKQHNWQKDDTEVQWTKSGGSPMSVLMPTCISNHVNFLGRGPHSEYATKWPGTIDGAVEAGKTTALSVLLNVRPQAVTVEDMTNITSKQIKDQQFFPWEVAVIQYACLFVNTIVFLSFLSTSYDD